ncbi:MAG: hypothetical protein HUK05_05525, partial [Prevotella sp.]|nr:hypothetical protein [Prevotella sp.]
MRNSSSRMIVMVVMFVAAMLALCPLMLRAQSNNSLTTMWKEYDALEKKDLPQSCLKLLEKISKKSESEKNYASLLKSEMKILNISYELAPDSMTTVRSKLKTKITALKGKDKVAYAIFNLAAYCAGYKMETPIQRSYLEEAFADMDILANTKADDWSYIVDKQAGSEAFNHDLLSIMGYQAREFKRLYDYYKTKGNRRACALLAQYSEVTGGEKNLTPYVEEYKDLPEGAYLAKLYLSSVHSTDKYYDLLQSYRKQWAGTKEGKMFENIERNEERANVHLSSMPSIVPINKEQDISVESKNVKKVRLVLIPLNVKARD